MSILDILSAEITNDPLSRGYAGMTNAEVAASLNTRNRGAAIPAKEVMKYFMLNGLIWSKVKLLSMNEAADVTARMVAIQAIDSLVSGAFQDFDVTDPVVISGITAQLDVLIAAGCMTSDDKVAILAKANNKRTRAEEIGLIGEIASGDVAQARA